MERKNSLISDFLIPAGYAILVYVIWEGTGFLASFVIGKITGNWTESLNNTYVVMLLQEISVFLMMYVLFHKKVDFVRNDKSSVSLLSAFAMLIFPLIQIGDDLVAIFYGKRVFSLFSGKGIQFFVICCIACLSIGLMEEFVWRGIILNRFLSAWKDKKKGIYFAVLISSLCFGLCHYMNLLAGQDFLSTTKQVISAVCMGVFLSAVYLQTNHLIFPILVHGLCDFSNFLMNEILGWDYSVWKYDDILQWILAGGYLLTGMYFVYCYIKNQQEKDGETFEGMYQSM